MLICHNCGTPIENRIRQCHHCHNFISTHAAVNVSENTIGNPLKIELETPPAVFNQIIAKEFIKAVSLNNGHSDNGHSGNGHEQIKSKENPANKQPDSAPEILDKKDNYFLSLTAAEKLSSEKLRTESPPVNFFDALPETTTEDSEKTTQSPISDHAGGEIKSTENNKANSLDWAAFSPADTSSIKKEKEEPKTDILSQMPLEENKTTNTPSETTQDSSDTDQVHRRSFSGNFSNSPKEIKTLTSPGKNEDFSSILNRMKSLFKGNLATDASSIKNNFFGLKPWQIALTALFVVFLYTKVSKHFAV